MTNTMKFYTPNWELMVSFTLNANTDIDGVCYDRKHFWTIEGTNGTTVAQYQMTASGPLATGFSFNAGTQLGLLWSRNTAICEDNKDLYIAYEYIVDLGGVPPVAQTHKGIAKFSKSGFLLRELLGSRQVSTGGSEYKDITFQGKLIVGTDDSGSGYNTFTYFDPSADGAFASIFVADRLFAGIAFNGDNYYCVQSSASGQGKTVNPIGVVQHNGANTVNTPRGIDFGNYDGSSLAMDFLGGRWTGDWIVLVHQ